MPGGARVAWADGATGRRTSSRARRWLRRRASPPWRWPASRRCTRAGAGMVERTDYDVLEKWSTLSFDGYTREVLARRLRTPAAPRFFEEGEFRLLEAVCARLLATPRGDPPLANCIDAELAEGRGQGFRVEPMPPD